jgi:group I intron endonuclease
MIGIYMIRNACNSHCYVGSSSDIQHRWNCHRSDFRLGKHHSRYMQKAWNKYGESVFEFIVLATCALADMYEQEQKYIDNLKPVYNVIKKAQGGQVGIKRSESFKQQLSKRMKGNKIMIGKHLSDEAKEKVSKSLIGNKRGAGHKHTPEHRQKIGKKSKGNIRAAKLNIMQVRQIRELYATGEYTQRGLATQFGVNQITVQAITSGRNWSNHS